MRLRGQKLREGLGKQISPPRRRRVSLEKVQGGLWDRGTWVKAIGKGNGSVFWGVTAGKRNAGPRGQVE